MWVNSWVTTRRSQSSVLPRTSEPAGHAAVITIALRGRGDAEPFAISV